MGVNDVAMNDELPGEPKSEERERFENGVVGAECIDL